MKTKLNLALMTFAAISCFKTNAQTNKTLSNLISPTAINQSLLPNTNNTKDLGSSALGWRDVYISNSLYLKGNIGMHSPGVGNFFVGNGSGNTSLTGTYNTGVGQYILNSLTTGYSNTASGAFALNSNSTGHNNTATGASALSNNISGILNTATGASSMNDNTTGSQNTATGYYSLFSNTTGVSNTAIGTFALNTNTTGRENTASGSLSLFFNTLGNYNTASGVAALNSNTTGDYNTASGYEAMRYNATGDKNTATGWSALYHNTTGERNAASGNFALYNNTTGYENTALGSLADVSTGNLHNATAIGAYTTVDASNKVRIGNTYVTSIGGQVGWTTFSDGRYKRNIKENVSGLAFINSLRPITYNVDTKSLDEYYNKGRKQSDEKIDEKSKAEMDKAADEASKMIQDGFVAQEVEEAAKKLGFEFSGVDKPKSKDGLYGLRYDKFVVPLVKAVQELSKQNDSLNLKMSQFENLKMENKELKSRLDLIEQKLGIASQNKVSTIVTLTNTSLQQNIPNPFTNTTTIHYTLPQKFSTAQIIITDNNGKTLKQINVSGMGKGMLNIDAAMFSSGTYNYSLIVDRKLISTKQMVLAK